MSVGERCSTAGEKDRKSGTGPGLGGDFDPAGVLFGQSMDSRQAEAGRFAGFFGGEKRFKEASLNFRCHAAARISHDQTDECSRAGVLMAARTSLINADSSGADGDQAAVRHGVTRIDNQMLKHLCDKSRVGRDRRQVQRKILFEPDFAAEQAALASQRVVPLFHLPVFYAASASLRDWALRTDGTIELANAWLGAVK